jgi:tRNA A-37 threonylcarbamoyl transferase component Bud32
MMNSQGSGIPDQPGSDQSGTFEDFGLTPRPRAKAWLVDPLLGTDLGGVKIIKLIGEGGMGRVYEARQEKPERTVAVKVIRQGITSEKTLRRFEREAEFLARLQHPGIAQIFIVGTYSSDFGDVPFYVMEHIADAKPITNYAHEKNLSLTDRLRLFQQVCEAVSHGHDKGIIHRDLKPGNILIDGNGKSRVIDFGVARSTDSDLTLTSLRTDSGHLVGTVQYMSPEQFGSSPDDLDGRADVYSLGVVLYELLAGVAPYELGKKGIHEAARVVCERPPTPLKTHDKSLRRDVCAITERCLEKDRRDRYHSAGELAADVGRFLAGEPLAGDGSISPVIRWIRGWLPRSRTGRRRFLVAAALLPATGVTVLGVAHLQREPVGPWEKTVNVSDQWVDTGFYVQKDRCYRLRAKGELTDSAGNPFGPEGTAPEALRNSLGPPKGISDEVRRESFLGQHPTRALIARIGDRSWAIHVGSDLTFIAPGSGPLAVKLNTPEGDSHPAAGTLKFQLAGVREPRFVNPDGSCSIAARIDDVDYLLITPEGLQWEYGGNWSRVGMHEGVYPTLVNGIAWWPDWPDPMKSSVLETKAFAQCCAAEDRLDIRVALQDTGVVTQEKSPQQQIRLRFEDMGLESSCIHVTLGRN